MLWQFSYPKCMANHFSSIFKVKLHLFSIFRFIIMVQNNYYGLKSPFQGVKFVFLGAFQQIGQLFSIAINDLSRLDDDTSSKRYLKVTSVDLRSLSLLLFGPDSCFFNVFSICAAYLYNKVVMLKEVKSVRRTTSVSCHFIFEQIRI